METTLTAAPQFTMATTLLYIRKTVLL